MSLIEMDGSYRSIEQLDSVDHALVEAIRSPATGKPSIFQLSQIVGGYRAGQLKLDSDTNAVLAITEIMVDLQHDVLKRPLDWSEYAGVLARIIKIDQVDN